MSSHAALPQCLTAWSMPGSAQQLPSWLLRQPMCSLQTSISACSGVYLGLCQSALHCHYTYRVIPCLYTSYRMCCSLLACITCIIFTQEIGSGGSRSLANVFAGGGDTWFVRAKRADAITHRLVFLYSLRNSPCNSAHQECNRAKVKAHAS